MKNVQYEGNDGVEFDLYKHKNRRLDRKISSIENVHSCVINIKMLDRDIHGWIMKVFEPSIEFTVMGLNWLSF